MRMFLSISYFLAFAEVCQEKLKTSPGEKMPNIIIFPNLHMVYGRPLIKIYHIMTGLLHISLASNKIGFCKFCLDFICIS